MIKTRLEINWPLSCESRHLPGDMYKNVYSSSTAHNKEKKDNLNICVKSKIAIRAEWIQRIIQMWYGIGGKLMNHKYIQPRVKHTYWWMTRKSLKSYIA